jgi:hypothetical protein
MDFEGDELYGDLVTAAKSVEDLKTAELLKDKDNKIQTLSEEVTQLRSQLIIVVNERQQLETNIVTLYNTAVAEMKRKDTEISDLRKLYLSSKN